MSMSIASHSCSAYFLHIVYSFLLYSYSDRTGSPQLALLVRVHSRAGLAPKRLVEGREVAQGADGAPVRRRVGVGADAGDGRGGARELGPDARKGEEEELVGGVRQAGELGGVLLRVLPRGVCLCEARVGNVLAIRKLLSAMPYMPSSCTHITVHIDFAALGVEDVVLGILARDALRALLEGLDGRVGPPVAETAFLVVLRARVVKRVSQLVGGDRAERAVAQVRGPAERVERRLEDAGREDDLAVGRRVVRVDGLV